MALQKSITDDIGVSVSYWIISQFRVDKINQRAAIVLAGYKNETQRNENLESGVIQRRRIQIQPDDFQTIYDNVVNNNMDLYTELYDYIKENEKDFMDATDV